VSLPKEVADHLAELIAKWLNDQNAILRPIGHGLGGRVSIYQRYDLERCGNSLHIQFSPILRRKKDIQWAISYADVFGFLENPVVVESVSDEGAPPLFEGPTLAGSLVVPDAIATNAIAVVDIQLPALLHDFERLLTTAIEPVIAKWSEHERYRRSSWHHAVERRFGIADPDTEPSSPGGK